MEAQNKISWSPGGISKAAQALSPKKKQKSPQKSPAQSPPTNVMNQIRTLQMEVLQRTPEEALPRMEECVNLVRKQLEPENIEYIYAHYLYADTLARVGEHTRAINVSETTLNNVLELEDKPQNFLEYYASLLYLLGLLYKSTENSIKSLHCFHLLLDFIQNHGVTSLQTETVQLTLADQLSKEGKFSEAKRYYKAVQSSQAFYSQATLKLGICLINTDNYFEAVKTLRELENLELNSEEEYNLLSYLAWGYISLKSYQKALAKLQKSKQVLERSGKNLSEDMGWTLARLGEVYTHLGKLEEAFQVLMEAKQLYENTLEESNYEIANVYTQTATIKAKQGRFQEALPLYQLARSLLRKNFGKTDLQSLKVSFEVLDLYFSQSKEQQAWNLLEDLVNDIKEANSTTSAYAYNQIGSILKKSKHHNEALECFLKALKFNGDSFGEDSLEVSKSCLNLGELLTEMNLLTQARIYLFRCKNIRQKYFGDKHIEMVPVYEALVKLYKAMTQFKDAKKLQQKIDRLKRLLVINI